MQEVSHLMILSRDHPDNVYPVKGCGPDLPRHMHGNIVSCRQQIDHIASLELDHEVGDAVLVMVADLQLPIFPRLSS